MQSKVFIHKESGEMKTIIPISNIGEYREANTKETKMYYDEWIRMLKDFEDKHYRVELDEGDAISWLTKDDAVGVAEYYYTTYWVATRVIDIDSWSVYCEYEV
jgi:hypothetical protein